MSDEEDYSSSSDEDYVPDEGEVVSEEENSGDEEDLTGLHADAEEDGLEGGKRGLGKRKKKHAGGIQARKRKGGIKVEGEDCNDDDVDTFNKELKDQIQKEQIEKKEEQEKKKADDLWSSFLSDVGSRPKPKPSSSSATPVSSTILSKPSENTQKSTSSATSTSSVPSTGKLTVTKEYDFAGETVRVTKDVDVNTKEGQKELKKLQDQGSVGKNKDTESVIQKSESSPGLPKQMPKKPFGGGLSSVLSKIGKKDKISTLDKSKLDWENFKHKEGIDEELKIHNRGKEGYIERLQFLNRTDQRQFELERDLRLASSSKR